MDRAMWDRWGAGSGVVFVALFVIGFLMLGDLPNLDDSAADTVGYFAGHHGRILTAVTLLGIASVFFIWFIATLAAVLRAAGEPRLAAAAYGGGLVLLTVLISDAILFAGLTFTIARTASADLTRALYELHFPLSVMIVFPGAAFVAAASIAGWRAKVFPDWLAWLGLAATIVLLVGGTTWADDGFWAPDGAYQGFITLIVFLVWLLATSVVLLLRRPRVADVPASAAAPAR